MKRLLMVLCVLAVCAAYVVGKYFEAHTGYYEWMGRVDAELRMRAAIERAINAELRR